MLRASILEYWVTRFRGQRRARVRGAALAKAA
jgi:hypothetical protein